MSKLSDQQLHDAVRIYESGTGLNAVAREFGMSSPGMRDRLVKAGVSIRGRVPAVTDYGPCRVDVCRDLAVYSCGLCNAHYLRQRRTGDPLGSLRKTVAERFWLKVDKGGPVPTKCPELGPCWLWTGAALERDYGNFNKDPQHRTWVLAHRFAYELVIGPIPEDSDHLHHRCETPPCVNPAHMKPVTYAEHGLEHRLGVCKNGHLHEDHGCYVRGRLIYCRACRRESRRAT